MAWEKPTVGFYKVNVSGVPEWGKDECAIGCVMRNDEGDYYGDFDGAFRCSDPIVVSLQAICHGLEFAWRKGKKKLILETDDATALQKILHPNSSYKYWALVGIVNQRMGDDWEDLQMGYVCPSMNGAAAALANYYLEERLGFGEMAECPEPVQKILEDEK